MKLKPTLLALAAFSCVTAAQASIYTFTGDTTGGPTFNRALEDLSDLSGIGTEVAYDAFEFTVSISGDYTFLTTGEFDTFVFLYEDLFNPSNPLMNGVVGNDDLLPGFSTSGFASTLEAGTTYAFVTTAYDNADAGAFSTTIGGPGAITAVPEPETFALMALGLGAIGFARRYAQSRSA